MSSFRKTPPARVAFAPQALFSEAVRQHQAGRLPQAERLYRQILAVHPRHADAVHMLGLLATQGGRHAAAADLIGRAIALDGSVAVYHFNLGGVLLALHRFDDAAAAYRAAARLQPDSPEVCLNLGVALQNAGQIDDALEAYAQALRLKPDYAQALVNTGNALYGLGRAAEALRAYREAVRLAPDSAKAYSNMAGVLRDLGQPEQAAAACRAALQIQPDLAEAHYNLGLALRDLDQPQAAAAAYRQALRLRPAYPEAHGNLGNLLYDAGRLDEAASAYRDALRHRPDFSKAWSGLGNVRLEQGELAGAIEAGENAVRFGPDSAEAHAGLGNALQAAGRMDEAAAAYRQAIRLSPDLARAHSNLGVALEKSGRSEEAVAACREALRLDPDFAEAHFALGFALLAQGKLDEGWQEYEWRWRTAQLIGTERSFPQPQWRGEEAEGRTLLIHAEQGLGDTLQFCRYASLAAARGLRVILEVQRSLVRLLAGLPGVAGVIAKGEALPPFDLHCPMLSLPLALGTTLATVPGDTPYLHPDLSASAAWQARLPARPAGARRVGLVWAGNPRPDQPDAHLTDRRRSIAPHRLAPLLAVPGVQFFSLQKGGPAAPAEFGLIDVMDEMHDFADTAALMATLDLVISVDTSVLHLAGALGRPVWLLDRFDHCWRWLDGRRDSPWYPSLRIYRQPAAGDWDSVIAGAARDLEAMARG